MTSLSNLYSQYLILSKTYELAIQEYNSENQQNITRNVILDLSDGSTLTFYIGRYDNLSTYYDTTENINSIQIYDGLIVTLYTETNFTGDSMSYMSTETNNYSTETINNTYQSLTVELIDKTYDTYPSKIFYTYTPAVINDTTSLDDCANLCINSNCNASVFNSSFNTCSIYNTPGRLGVGTVEDETIIPKNKRKLLIITELNNKLKYIIQQIKLYSITILKDNDLSLQQKDITLEQYYKNKREIKKLETYLEQQKEIYQSLEAELTNSSSIIMRNVNLYYLMWLFLIILFFIIVKSLFMPVSKSNPKMLIYIILIICIILASYNINNPYGYLLWCILILILILNIILPRI
jgi:hypothetical protein